MYPSREKTRGLTIANACSDDHNYDDDHYHYDDDEDEKTKGLSQSLCLLIIIIIIIIIIITRPRPAFGRLGLGWTSHASLRACGAQLGGKSTCQ